MGAGLASDAGTAHHLAGLRSLPDIARGRSVDGVFIGPVDLAASLGYLGDPAHPEVQTAIADALHEIPAAGKAAGILTSDAVMAPQAPTAVCSVVS